MPLRDVLFYLIVLLIAYGIVGTTDYTDEMRTELEAAEATSQRLLDCINGKPLGYTERKPRSAFDHGRTYTICRVEEIDV